MVAPPSRPWAVFLTSFRANAAGTVGDLASEAPERPLYRLPGRGLVVSNIGAGAIFAALTGSSPVCGSGFPRSMDRSVDIVRCKSALHFRLLTKHEFYRVPEI